jgi:hypothetical protein
VVQPKNDEHPPIKNMQMGEKRMSRKDNSVQKIHEEFAKFEKAMEELNLLRQISQDLKNYKEMIKLKRYD